MSDSLDYWKEGIADAAEECGAQLTEEQLTYIAQAVEGGHKNYGMAFYSPPPSERTSEIDREWRTKYEALQREFDEYRGDAETAVRRALKQFHDTQVSIEKHGDVFRHGGRSEQIQ